MKNKLSTSLSSALVAFSVLAGAQAWAQNGRISTVAVATGVVTVTERTASNANAPVTTANQPVYVGDVLAGLTFFNGNPGIDGTPTNTSVGSPTSAVLFTLTGSLIPGGAATDLHAFMGYGTIVGPPTQAATYNDVAPKLAAGTTYSGLTFAEPNLYPGGPAPLIANEFYTINRAVNGTDYLAAIRPGTGVTSAVLNIKPMSWQGGVSATAADTSSVNGYFALTFAEPTPAGPYFANLFYYLRTDTANHTQFGYVIPALVSKQLDTLDLTTATGGFGAGNYKALAFSPVAFGGYAASQFYYLREDTGPGRTGNTILGRLDTTPGNRTLSDIANLGGVYRTLTYVFNATGTAPAWGSNQLFVAGSPLAAGAQSISFEAITPIDRSLGVPFAVSPTASSALGITLTVAASSTGTATIVSPLGGIGTFTVTPTSPGIVTLRATQPGSVAPLVVSNFFEQSFNVLGPITTLVIPTKALTAGTAAVSFVPVTATGGTGAITWSILPLLANGSLVISPTTGAISGTPATAAGATNYTVTATDATLATSSKTFSLTINPALVANLAVPGTSVTTNLLAAPFAPVTAVGGSSPFTFAVTPLPAGLAINAGTGQITGTPTLVTPAANYTVAITDSAGATANQTFSLAVNPGAPVITSATVAAGTVGTPFVTYNIVATGSPTSYGATGLPAGLTFNTVTGAINGTPTTAGIAVVTLSATNSTGSDTHNLTITVAAAGVVPVITSATTAAGTVGTPFVTYNIIATGSPTSYGATGLPAGLAIVASTGAIGGTPTTAGVSVVTLSATNSTGSDTHTLTITVAAAGVAPVITSATVAAGTVGTPFATYAILATGTPTSYGATGLPAGLAFNSLTGKITGTPTTAGVSVVTLSATNSTGSDTHTLTITVAAAGVAPVITSATVAAGTVGTPFVTYAILATGTPTSYSATGLPAGLAVNALTGTINGTPTTAGVSVVTLGATNSTGSTSTALTITVAAAGVAPIITSATVAAGTVGTPFVTYNILATGTPTSYGATGLPGGLAFNSLTGKISGTPTTAGSTTVVLSATNATGTGIATLTITVADVVVPPVGPPVVNAPIILSPTTAAGTLGTPFATYQIIATGSPTSYGATDLPAGLTVNTLTGAINGTPTSAGTTVVNLSATNSGGTGTATVTITVAPTGIAPVITSPLTAGGTVGTPFPTYLITATGSPTSYGATNLPPGLFLNALTGAITGTPTRDTTTFVAITATNAAGTGAATLMIITSPAAGAPVITSPTSTQGTVGVPFVTYLIVASGSPTSYSATGLPPGLTVNPLTGAINGTPTAPGTYVVTLTATNSSGNTSTTVTMVVASATSSRIVNFSARALSGPGEQTLILGFVVKGDGKDLLVRGIGPGLVQFGVNNELADPLLTLYGRTGVIATNDDWQTTFAGQADAALVAATAARVGAFALANGSKDSALLAVFNDGAHTSTMLRPASTAGTAGVALTEIYDTDTTTGPRLINVSARMNVTAGEGTLIAGFAIAGNAPKTLLIRGVGPTLNVFGVVGAMADPQIAVYSGSAHVASNDDWGTSTATPTQLSNAAAEVGAFALAAGSKDAVLLVTLQPGTYTVQVTGVGNTTGVALVEIYDTQ